MESTSVSSKMSNAITAIEIEARAYVGACRLEPLPTRRYLVGLLAALDARDAEIARISKDVADTGWLIDLLSERDTEIARLRAPPGADVTERACNVVFAIHGESYPDIEGINDDIQIIAETLQQYGDERAAAAREAAIEEAIVVIRNEGWIGDDARPLLTSLRALAGP